MTATAERTTPAKKRRRSPGWVPNQHGAWAMLASPLLLGILAGGPAWVHVPLTAFWFVGYFAFFAASLWLKSRRRPRYFPPVRAYVPAAAVLGLLTAALDPSLVVWAPAFALPLGVGLWAAASRHERDLLAGLTTVIGSGLMTLVAYDAGAGSVDERAWLLALVQFLYFAGTVFYVKSAIREHGNPRFLALSTAVHALATLTMAWISWPLAAVFALLTLRAAVVPPMRFSPKALGFGEIASTLVVALVSLATV